MRQPRLIPITLIVVAFLSILITGCSADESASTATARPLPEETASLMTPESAPTMTLVGEGGELTTPAVEEDGATRSPDTSGLMAVIVSGDVAGAGKPFTFDGTQSQAGAVPIVDYVWSMGDGTTLFGLAVEHAFNEPGFYTVTLIISDEEGQTDTSAKVVEVVPLEDLSPPTVAPDDPAMALIGTFWAMNYPVRGTTVTLLFGEEMLSGSSGCNSYEASYTVTPAEGASADISVGPIDSTNQACTQEVMAQERGYLEIVTSAKSVTIDGETLILESANGTLTFNMAQSTE